MPFWKPISLLLALRGRVAANDLAENATAFLGRALLAVILGVAGASMYGSLGSRWPLLTPQAMTGQAAAAALGHLLLITHVFWMLGLLVPGAVTLLGRNPPDSVLRAFALSRAQRVTADLLACLLDAPAAIVAVAVAPLAAGLILGGAWAAGLCLILVLCLLAVFTCALVRLLADAGTMLRRGLRRRAEIPALTGLFLVCLCGAVPPAFASLTTAPPQNPRAVHIRLPALPAFDPTPAFPSAFACRAVMAADRGDWPDALRSLTLLSLAACAVLGLALGASRRALSLPGAPSCPARRVSIPRRPSAPVSMRTGPAPQIVALALTELKLLVRKPESYLTLRGPAAMVLIGVLGFLVPDMGRDPVYSVKELLGLGGVLYNVLWQMQLLCNRFGSESGTATALFSLSIPRWRLVLGKNVALLAVLLALDSIALAALCVVAEAPDNILPFLGWLALALVVLTALGNIVSVLAPFSISRHDSRNRTDAPDGLAFAYVCIGVAAGLLLWPVAAVAGRGVPGAIAAAAYALALYSISVFAAAYVLRGNERQILARLDRSRP